MNAILPEQVLPGQPPRRAPARPGGQRGPSRSWGRRVRGCIVCLGATALLSGCATCAGLPVSPLMGAYGGVAHSSCSGWDKAWGYPLGVIAGLAWGPVMSLAIGVTADVGFVAHGAYGEDGNPSFGDVFDPFGYAFPSGFPGGGPPR